MWKQIFNIYARLFARKTILFSFIIIAILSILVVAGMTHRLTTKAYFDAQLKCDLEYGHEQYELYKCPCSNSISTCYCCSPKEEQTNINIQPTQAFITSIGEQ